MSDFIHMREFIVYSPLVEPTPVYGLHIYGKTIDQCVFPCLHACICFYFPLCLIFIQGLNVPLKIIKHVHVNNLELSRVLSLSDAIR